RSTRVSAAPRFFLNPGEVSEWLKEHAWKACVGETLPWVRIPPSPPRIPNPERCQSGRMGRSRKPLTGQPVRGFESHPLRHLLDSRAAGELLYWFRSMRAGGPIAAGGPAISHTISKKAVQP